MLWSLTVDCLMTLWLLRRWYDFNDSSCSVESGGYRAAVTPQAYVLFYRRRPAPAGYKPCIPAAAAARAAALSGQGAPKKATPAGDGTSAAGGAGGAAGAGASVAAGSAAAEPPTPPAQ